MMERSQVDKDTTPLPFAPSCDKLRPTEHPYKPLLAFGYNTARKRMAEKFESTMRSFALGTFFGRQRQINIVKNSVIALNERTFAVAWTSSPSTLCISTIVSPGKQGVDSKTQDQICKIELATNKIKHIETFSWKKVLQSVQGDGKETHPTSKETSHVYYLSIGGLKSIEVYEISFDLATITEDNNLPQQTPPNVPNSTGPKYAKLIYTSSEEFSEKIGRICSVNFDRSSENMLAKGKFCLFVSGKKQSACFQLNRSSIEKSNMIPLMYVDGPVQNTKTFHCWNDNRSVAMTAAGELRVHNLNAQNSYHTCFCADIHKEKDSTVIPTLSDIIHVNTKKSPCGNMKTSLFVGHGNTTVALSSSSSILDDSTGGAEPEKKCLNQVYRDMRRAKKKKSQKKESEIAGESESITNVSSSMDSGGVIDLTSLQSSRDNLIIGGGNGQSTGKISSTLSSLMNISSNGNNRNSTAPVLIGTADAKERGNMSVPSLIFFKYVKNDAEDDSSKLYGIGSIASKFSADYMVTFAVGPQRESSLVVIGNRAMRKVCVMQVNFDINTDSVSSKELHSFQINPSTKDKSRPSLVGLTLLGDQLLALVALREKEATFFSAESSEYQYELQQYSLAQFVKQIERDSTSARQVNLAVSPLTSSKAATTTENDSVMPSAASNSIITAIEKMQTHFDARLDRIEGMLLQHSMRLSRIESMQGKLN